MSSEAEPASERRVRWSLPPNIGPGGASPQSSGEAESSPRGSGEADPALGRRVRQSPPLDVGRGGVQPSGVRQGGASPQGSGKAEPTFGRLGKIVVAFLSVRKHQCLMVISSFYLGTSVFGPRQ